MLTFDQEQKDAIHTLISKVKTDLAKEAIRTADELADMIIFHAKVRENVKIMKQPWDM